MNYREQLVKNILPFWLDNAMDYEKGGIFTALTEKAIYTDEKKVSGFRAEHSGLFPRHIT